MKPFNCRTIVAASVALLASTAGSALELSQEHRDAYARCRALQEQGNWSEAREVIRELAATFASSPPSAHRLAFENELANLEQRLGDYGKALAAYERCMAMAMEVTGPESATTSSLLNNFAALHQVLGNFGEAERANREALRIRVAIAGEESPDTVPARNNLAGLLWCIGDFAGAEALYRQSLEIRDREVGRESPDTARSMENLGGLLFYRGRIDEAEPLARESAAIFERTSGPDHPDTWEALLFLGEIERARGRPAEALAIYRGVLEARLAKLGREHVETAEAHRRVADALRETNALDAAIRHYQESDAIYLGILPSTHPDRIEGLYGLGLASLAVGDPGSALLAADRCAEVEFANFEAMLRFTDERQRLAYQDIFRSPNLLAQLGESERLCEFLLRQKGIVLDSLLDEARLSRDHGDPAVQDAQKRLAASRTAYRSAFLGSPPPGTDLASLEEEVRRCRQELLDLLGSSEIAISQGKVEATEFRQLLGPDEAFLDYLAYQHYLTEASFEERFALVLSTREGTTFHELGPTSSTEDLVEAILPFFGSAKPGEDSNADALAAMQELHELVIGPAAATLRGKSRILLSPTGALSFVPFACLVDRDGRFLVESFDIEFVSSGRDLLDQGRTSETVTNGPAVVVGNPAFETGRRSGPDQSDSRGLLASFSTASLVALAGGLAPLPGAEIEAGAIAPLLETHLGTPSVALFGESATEEGFREAISHPRFLHMATHGLYLPAALESANHSRAGASGVPAEIVAFQNPMFGSCLALSGASDTFADWSRGIVPPPESDGVFMANEAAELDLTGTEVVVLSACDTASGEATGGDGVLGLRRGFRLAGAETVVSTLWPISDAATVAIMEDFYQGLAGSSPAASLSAAQRKWLVHFRDKTKIAADDPIPAAGFYWAINLAGPFLATR